jgi:hypothetical protein
MAIDTKDLQAAVDAAPPHSTLLADKRHEFVIDRTVRVTKPVTIVGLRARLREKLGRTPLMEVTAEGVVVRDFLLTGNISTVEYADRASLIVFRRGHFIVENGLFLDSAKDGVTVTPVPDGGHIEHGVIRNIVGRNNARDLVSIAGLGERGLFVRHVLVENVRCYDSPDRGAAEASDGSEFITFRDIYSESSFYGIDIQDHNRKGQVNRNIVIDGLHVRDCVTAVRTGNHDFGHTGLFIRNVQGERFRGKSPWRPIHIKNVENLQLENIRIQDNADGPLVYLSNSSGVVVRDLFLSNTGGVEVAVLVENVDNALLDNVSLDDAAHPPDVGVVFRISDDRRLRSLRVMNCLLGNARSWGLVAESSRSADNLDTLWVDAVVGRTRIDLKPRVSNVQ